MAVPRPEHNGGCNGAPCSRQGGVRRRFHTFRPIHGATMAAAGRSHPDPILMSLAARQHGVVARAQLLRAGVSKELIDHRLRNGRLQPLHRGVYRVGPLVAPYSPEMAAVLACGQSAALSHRSAAGVWGILPRMTAGERIEIIVARGRSGRRPGIRVRHLHALVAEEVTVHECIPITTVDRTLYDLAGTVRGRQLERAVAEAFSLLLSDRAGLIALLDRHPRQPGVSRLRALLDGGVPLALTRSEAEERFLALVRSGGLDRPEANVTIAGSEVDFLWRRERLVVEVDGFAFHSTDRRFERDRRRDAMLVGAGLRVMRVTWHQITREPNRVLVHLAQALARTLPT